MKIKIVAFFLIMFSVACAHQQPTILETRCGQGDMEACRLEMQRRQMVNQAWREWGQQLQQYNNQIEMGPVNSTGFQQTCIQHGNIIRCR